MVSFCEGYIRLGLHFAESYHEGWLRLPANRLEVGRHTHRIGSFAETFFLFIVQVLKTFYRITLVNARLNPVIHLSPAMSWSILAAKL